MRRAAVLATVVLALATTACDTFLDYTVVNETNQSLLTWPIYHANCDTAEARQQLDVAQIGPYETFDYSSATRADDPDCIVVATLDKRPVLIAEYGYADRYVVSDPVNPTGESLPELAEPTDPRGWDLFFDLFTDTHPIAAAIWAMFFLGLLGGISYVIVYSAIQLYRAVRARL